MSEGCRYLPLHSSAAGDGKLLPTDSAVDLPVWLDTLLLCAF